MTGESFPPEITREILLKLPVESLLRCKSVCKEWYSLISNQHFIKSHYNVSSTNSINFEHHRFIYNGYRRDKKLTSCPLYDVLFDKSLSNALVLDNNMLQRPPPQDVRIVGSCNGLLCIVEEGKDALFIYNPATRRSNLLPCSQRGGLFARYFGFGYDELSNDYKVVITGFRLEMTTITYSLKTGKWKEIGHFPCARPLDEGKFFNGALHWVAGNCSTLTDLWKIVSLDLANETYSEVLQPEHHVCNDCLSLGVLGEWLCALYSNYLGSPLVNVWVMKVYGVEDSWTKLASIPYVWYGLNLAPLCISKDGKLILQFEQELLVYDSKDGSSMVIDNEGIDACIVVESLVSPFPPSGLADNNDHED